MMMKKRVIKRVMDQKRCACGSDGGCGGGRRRRFRACTRSSWSDGSSDLPYSLERMEMSMRLSSLSSTLSSIDFSDSFICVQQF